MSVDMKLGDLKYRLRHSDCPNVLFRTTYRRKKYNAFFIADLKANFTGFPMTAKVLGETPQQTKREEFRWPHPLTTFAKVVHPEIHRKSMMCSTVFSDKFLLFDSTIYLL